MRFCVISTGGTIASSPGDEGLTPTMRGEQLLSHIPDLRRSGSVSVVDLLSKDSSNMHPDDWVRIARCILERRDEADGFLILHGTDTMAYTASALSYMLLGFDRPVVLTGSMHPIDVPGTDAIDNVRDSLLFVRELAKRGQMGVSISFGGLLIHGPRSQKILSHTQTAFSSINYPVVGTMDGEGPSLRHRPEFASAASAPFLRGDAPFRMERSILLVTLFPGFLARHLEAAVAMQPKAIVVEALGMGGVPYLGESLLPPIEHARNHSIPVVITTQCVYGGVDLSVYEVGRKTLRMGVISGKDMSREAIITKLMLLLPHLPEGDSDALRESFHAPLCDEVSRD